MKVLGFVIALALASPVVGQALAVPVPAKSFQPMGSVRLAKLVVNLNRGDRIGSFGSGLCLLPEELTWRSGKQELRDEEFESVFRDEMKREGFTVPGDPGRLFEDQNGNSVDMLVGAAINRIDMKACFPTFLVPFSGDDLSRGSASVDVEWQIYSPLERKVVATLKVTGSAQWSKSRSGGAYLLEQQAFADAVQQLARSAEFRQSFSAATADGSVARTPPPNLVPLQIRTLPPATVKLDDVVTSTVLVFAGGGHGSGFLVSPEGYVLTNHHVVGSASYVKVRWSDRSEVLGEVVRTDAARDVALIKTDARGRRPLPLRGTPVAVGEEIYAVGAPADQQFQGSVTRGIVSAKRVYEGFNFIQSDVGVTHGNSGGPIVDAKGQVVGLTDIGFEGAPMLNLFIPIDEALSFLGLQIAPASLPAPASIRPKR